MISDIDERITDYENKLRELKIAFLEGVTVQTGVTVVRMMNVVEHTGMSDISSDCHRTFTSLGYSGIDRPERYAVCVWD